MTDTPTLECRSLFINNTANYKQLPTPQPKSPFKLRNVLLSTVPYGLPWIPFAINFFVV